MRPESSHDDATSSMSVLFSKRMALFWHRLFEKSRLSLKSVSSVNLQIELDTIADTVILKRELILERPFALPFQ